MKRLTTLLSFLILAQVMLGQLSGSRTIPSGNYPSIKVAVDSLNLYGVGSGGITFNVTAGHTESSADSIMLTATGTVSDPIVFQKSGTGANPIVTRTGSGTRSTSTLGGQGDAVIIIQGSDYVTFDYIDVATNDQGIEYGYYLRKASGSDGCKNLAIRNSTITMTKGTSQYVVGIYSSNNDASSPVSSSTGITVTSTGGRHEYVTIEGNTISNVFVGIYLRGYNASAPYDYYDQNFTVGQTGRGNIIQNYAGNSASTAYGIYAIYHNNLSAGYNVINNTAGGGSGFTYTGYGIFFSTGTSSNATIDGNEVTLTSIATTSALYGISNSMGSTAAGNTVTISNNIVDACNYSTATSASFYGVYNSASAATVDMYGNIVSNNTLSGTGTIYGLYCSAGTTMNIFDNTVSGNQKTGAYGTIYGTYASTGIVYYHGNNIYDNAFTNSSGSSSCNLYGYYNNGSPAFEYLYDNTIYNLSVAGTNTGTSSILTGIYTNSTSTATKEIYNNNIYNLTALSGSMNGIYQGYGASVSIYKNNIYNLSNNTTVTTTARTNGITIASGNVYTYNNFISDLKAPACASVDAIRGINITSSTINSTVGIYYNTIYLNATSSGSDFGTTGLYHTYSSTSTTASLDMRNNVIVNNSIPVGTGFTVAFRRSAATNLNNFGSSSNNNNLYAGTPGASNLIFYDGTNSFQYIADYKSFVSPRESASFSENPPFVNVSLTPYDLHMLTSVSTQCESGGSPISTPIAITTDFDGNTRNVSTPDVGADEFSGIGADFTPPSISYALLTNTSLTSNRSFTNVDITDNSGINTTSGTRPRVYFKRKTDGNLWIDNTSGSDGWKWMEANGTSSPFDFTIDYSLLNGGTGVTTGDTVEYFVVAQDLAATPNVGINSGTFAATPTSVALTGAAFPIGGTINYYVISQAISGTVTVGSGGTYTSLTGAGGLFADINSKVVTGNITANILSNLSETGLNALNQWSEDGAGGYTLTIQPNAASIDTISGKYLGGLIRLNGADRVTIDGRYGGSGKYLVISNDTTGSLTAAIQIISLGSGAGAVNNTIRNCYIFAGANNVASTFGIFAGGASISTSGTGADNDNLTITENTISRCKYGIYAKGIATTGELDMLTISGNTIGSDTASYYVTEYGISLQAVNGAVISNNEIYNMIYDGSKYGIHLGSTVYNSTFSKNDIHTFSQSNTTSSYYAIGIYFSSTTGCSNNQIDNNAIYDLYNYGSTSNFYNSGIRIVGGSDYKLYYNSISMSGAFGSTTAGVYSHCLHISTASTNMDLRNNIFSNTRTGNAPKTYTIYAVSGTTFTTIDYNDYYTTGAYFGYFGSEIANFTAWQTATSQDANSLNANPQFNSNLNLAPNLGSPVLAAGTPIGGITTDILNSARSGTNPSMGAYENGIDASGPSISYTLLSNNSSTSTLSFSNVTITDPSGVNTTSGTRPRVYYKRSTDANTWNDNTSGTDGWKWAEANGTSSPFDFTLNYSLLYGGTGVSLGTIVQYFVVAQDLQGTPYVSINSGTFAATPSSVALTSAAFPIGGTINSYQIVQSYAGSYNVGAGQTYTSLTANTAQGLFKALNEGVLSGNIIINVVSDLTETGEVALNQWAEEGAGNYTLTIQPDAATVRNISGGYAGALIRLNGANRVTFNGEFTSDDGSNYLNITNTNTSGIIAAIQLISLGSGAGCSNVTINNCNISTGHNGSGAYGIAVGGATIASVGADNDNLTIRDNNIFKAYVGIWAQGSGTSNPGLMDNIQILRNSLGSSISTNYLGHDGIIVANGSGGLISQNTVFNIITSASTPVGITLSTGFVSSQVKRNNINNITYTGTSGFGGRGMYINTDNNSSNLTIDNNVIYAIGGDGYTSFYNSSMVGMYFDGATTGDIDIYYNSIYLSGNYARNAATLTAAILFFNSGITSINLRDNIFVNSMDNTTVATDKNYAIYSVAPAGSFTSINYNDYYATGTEGVLGYLGADQTTLAAWQTATGQDANSISADPQFNAVNNLQPLPGSPVLAAGTPIGGITYDYLNVTRSVTTPTIGAYENGADFSPPSISYTALTNTYSTSNRSFSNVTITDFSGVNTTSGTKPRVYYKRETDANAWNDNTSSTDGWKYAEANGSSSPFDFTIDYSLLYGGTGVSAGDVIQYFVVAQDLTSTPNVGINSGTFAATPASVALTSSAFPISGTINNYTIAVSLSGTINVGTGQTYTSLTGNDKNGLFKAINTGDLSGNLTVNIVSDMNETGAVALNQWIETGGSGYTVTIQPSATTNRNISGSYPGGLIRLNGADRVTIDGRYGGDGNYLSFTNTSTSANSAVFQIISLGAGAGATDNTIRNCNIMAGANGSAANTFGIYAAGATISTTGTGNDNDNLTIAENRISRAYNGIYVAATSTGKNDNLLIQQNTIGTNTPTDYITNRGIVVIQANNSIVTQNTVFNMITSEANVLRAMEFGTGVTNTQITRNKIYNISHTGTGFRAGQGISVSTGATGANLTVANNVIYGLKGHGSSTATNNSWGIMVLGGGGYNIYYNSIHISDDRTTTGSTDLHGAIYIASSVTGLDIRNNAFSITGDPGNITNGYVYAIYCLSANTAFTTINYNDYYASGSRAVLGYIASTNQTTLLAWQTATTQDANSIATDPLFNTNTNLYPQAGSPLLAAGTPVSITNDFLNVTRSLTTPSMGAYENGGDAIPPEISYVLLTNTTSTSNRAFSGVAITDASGVNTTPGTRPRVYYKRSTDANTFNDNTNSSDGWKWVESNGGSSPFDFTIDYSLLNGGTGVSTGNLIQYFVIAQDNSSLVNIGINSGEFFTAPSSVALTSAAFPISGTINGYYIGSAISGTKTIGPSSDYTNLTGENGLFKAINENVLSGNVTAYINDSLTEEGTYALNQLSEEGTGGYTLTIKPNTSVTALISGSYAGQLIRLNGASRVIIDGSNSGGTNRDLTISNTSTSATGVILIGSVGTNPITDVTIKNCNLINGTTNSSALLITDGTTPGDAGYFDNITIQNNSLQKAYIGSYIRSVAGQGTNLTFADNNLNTSGTNNIRYIGVYLEGINGAVVSGNTIANFEKTSAENDFGLWLASGSTNIDVYKNLIENLGYTGSSGYGAHGIHITTTQTGANIKLYNNVITNITGDGDDYVTANVYNPTGIYLSSTQSGISIYNNSIYLYGNTLNYSTSSMSQGIFLGTGSVADIRNNLIVNNLGLLNTTGYGACGIYAEASNTQFTSIDYNDYFINPTGSGAMDIGRIAATPSTTLGAWQIATGQDANSLNANPLFSDAVLHLSNPYSPAIGKATPLGAVTDDYSGILRHPTYPTMGAHEYPPNMNWLGYTSSWNSASNWSLGSVPDETYWVIIPTAPVGTNFPIVPAGTWQCYGFTLENGATLDIQGTLEVTNNVP